MPHTCPQCGSGKIRGASLHTHDGLRRMLLYTPLRCRDCRHRFWVFNSLKPLLLLVAVGALVGLTTWLALDPPGPATRLPTDPALPHARAEQGDAEAQLHMGMRYAAGDGVLQDDKEAARWFALAAKQELTEAQYQYGLVLLRGRGVVQDYKSGFSWIEKPAKRGHAKAQYSLGELYRYGTGTAIDKPRAYLWFNLAAAQGIDAAAKARDSLVWQLKPEQLAAMQEEARHMEEARRAGHDAPAPSPGPAEAAPPPAPAHP